jgi:hypothetical protein
LLSFSAPFLYNVGSVPTDLATADLNGDGKLDLVVAQEDSNEVGVMFGNGNGTFQAPVNYAVGSHPRSVRIADVNHDGKPDIIVANYNDDTVSVLLNAGGGNFSAPVTYSAGAAAGSHCIAVGDLNGDGNPDVVVANRDSGGALNVLFGNADGTFQAPVTIASGVAYDSVAIADLNGDGKPDLAATSTDGNMSLFFGNGSGQFTAGSVYGVGSFPHSIVAADFTGSGKTDLAECNFFGGDVTTWLGDGSGSFSESGDYGVGSSAAFITIGNFSGTGHADLVVANRDSNDVSWLQGNGDGTFQQAVSLNVGGTGAIGLAVGDFNGDGAPDLAVANSYSNTVAVLMNEVPVTSFAVSAPASVAAGSSFSITVTATTQNGATAPWYTGTVHFTSSDPTATLPTDYTFTAADAGSHTFTGVVLTRAGTMTIAATDTSTATLTGHASIVVHAGPATHLAVAGASTTVAGTPITVTVRALDAYGNVAPTYRGTIHFTTTDLLASIPPDYAFAAADHGKHTFANGVTLKTAGAQTVAATDTTTSTIVGSKTVKVLPAAAQSFIVTGFPTDATAGQAYQFAVIARDAYGNIATGYRGQVGFTSSDGQAVLPANYTFTKADAGVHTFTAILDTPGDQSITATDLLFASLSGEEDDISVQ